MTESELSKILAEQNPDYTRDGNWSNSKAVLVDFVEDKRLPDEPGLEEYAIRYACAFRRKIDDKIFETTMWVNYKYGKTRDVWRKAKGKEIPVFIGKYFNEEFIMPIQQNLFKAFKAYDWWRHDYEGGQLRVGHEL